MASILRNGFFFTLTALAVVLMSACGSPQSKREAFTEKIGPPQTPLAGQALYFTGQIEAQARFTASISPGRTRQGESMATGGGPPPGRERFDRGSPGPVGRRAEGEGFGAGRPHPGGGGPGFSAPRQSLSLSLTNRGTSPVLVTITEVNSILGNFVPIPAKATLAPGETVTLEPMRGTLANLDALNLTLALSSNGASEKQEIVLTAK